MRTTARRMDGEEESLGEEQDGEDDDNEQLKMGCPVSVGMSKWW